MTLSNRVKTQLRAEFEPRVTAYVGTLAVTASVTAVGLVATGYGIGNGWSVMALAFVAAVAERGRVHLTSTTEESISLLPTLFAAILFGPLAGMAVGAASLLGEFGQPAAGPEVLFLDHRRRVDLRVAVRRMMIQHPAD